MANTINSISLALIVTLFCFSAHIQAQSQRVSLYSGVNQGGQFLNLGASYVSDLSGYGFNNLARSTCVTGVWLFYDIENFNNGFNAGMEYVFGNNYCVNFQGLGAAVSSLRYAGPPNDYRLSSLTFFVGTYFQGFEEFVQTDLPNLSLSGRIASFLITGAVNEGWTIYDRPNYGGNAVCVFPPVTDVPYEPAFIYDTNLVFIPHNTILSVRKGCFGKDTKRVNVEAIATRQGFQSMSKPVVLANQFEKPNKSLIFGKL